ncbi:MAG: ribonuclease P protein component [bacterium]
MLKRASRLKKNNDFKAVFKKGRVLRGVLADIWTAPNGLELNRFGFIAGLKVSKSAVIRNRARRQLSEIFKEQRERPENGVDVVVIAKPMIVGKTQKEIFDDVGKNFKKINLSG